MSSSSRSRVEDTYESQNDQQLDDLHSKLRTLRGVTQDIYDDVERQNTMLDDANDRFNSFATSLTQTSDRLGRTFGVKEGSLKTFRIALWTVTTFIIFWFGLKIYHWWWPAVPAP